MPGLVLDTNILMADFQLRGAQMRIFLAGNRRCNNPVYFPEVVLDELKGNHARQLNQHKNSIEKEIVSLNRLGVDLPTREIDLDREKLLYESTIRSVMSEFGINVAPYPSVSTKELITASYHGKRPFKDSGAGHKDFLVFHTLLSVIGQLEDDVWFLTSNSKDFCGSDGQLHRDLNELLPSSCSVRVFGSVKEFNDAVLLPQLSRLDGIEVQIRDAKFEGFDLEAMTSELLDLDLRSRTFSPDEVGLSPVFDEPSIYMVHEHSVDDLRVSRLTDKLLLIELEGAVHLEFFGFISNTDLYTMSEEELLSIHINDPNWNDHVASATAVVNVQFEMSVVFDEVLRDADSVSVSISTGEDM